MNCRECAWKNGNSVCEKYGHLVEDDDICFPVYEVRCSWCGQRTTIKKLQPVGKAPAGSKHAEYQFFCRTCRAVRYFRQEDIRKWRN